MPQTTNEPTAVTVATEEAFADIWSRRLTVLWKYRLAMLIATIAGAIACLALIWSMPSEAYAVKKFRLLFDGAEKGQYPSGVRFSPNDVIARAVLDEVYASRRSALGQYGTFEEFQPAFFVAAKPSPEMEALDAEFSAKLSGKLTAVERSQIEKEYQEKKAGLVNSVEWSLSMLISGGPGQKMPSELREQILSAVLDAWADDAAKRKGAIQYQIDVLSKNILPRDIVDGEDFFVAADMLRLKLNKIRLNIEQILDLPGAKTYRSRQDNISLGEIRSNLEDMLRFRLIPLMHWIRAFGLSEKKELTRLYIESGIDRLTLDKKEAADRAKVMEEALLSYSQERRRMRVGTTGGASPAVPPKLDNVPAMIPQFGDSFLDRIIELTGQSNDVKFRQDMTERVSKEALKEVEIEKDLKLYEDMLKSMDNGTTSRPPQGELQATALKTVKERLAKVYDDMVQSVDQVEAIYQEISGKNLNPRTHLYNAWEPASTRVVRTASLPRLAAYCLLLMTAAVGLAAAGCLWHAQARRTA